MANACGSGSLSICRKKRLRSSGYLVPERRKESYKCSTNRSLSSMSIFEAIFFFRKNRKLLKFLLLDLTCAIGRTSSYVPKRRSFVGKGSTSSSLFPELERHVASNFEANSRKKHLSFSFFERVPRRRDAMRCMSSNEMVFLFFFFFRSHTLSRNGFVGSVKRGSGKKKRRKKGIRVSFSGSMSFRSDGIESNGFSMEKDKRWYVVGFGRMMDRWKDPLYRAPWIYLYHSHPSTHRYHGMEEDPWNGQIHLRWTDASFRST